MKKTFLILLIGIILISGCTEEMPLLEEEQPPKETTEEIKDIEATSGKGEPEEPIVTKTAEDCEKKTYKDGCYTTLATETKNSSLCEKITDSYKKDWCYINLAPIIKDISLCEKVVSNIRKEMCYSNVAKETKDASFCGKITDGSDKDWCYFNIAIETKNSSLCEKVTDTFSMKNRCYAGITGKPAEETPPTEKVTPQPEEEVEPIEETEPGDECEKITDSWERDICYTDLALETKDVSLCEKVIGIRDTICYINVAAETKDTSICENQALTMSWQKADCYTKIAIKTEDSSYCEKITGFNEDLLKDMCYSDFESG